MSFESDESEVDDSAHNQEVDWNEHVFHEERNTSEISLDLTDYAALFIASLQTIFLPLIILAIIMVSMGMFFGLLW